jgi:putative peptidoglycan lipid II flippase
MTQRAIARDAGTVTGWNLVSRLSGFVRVLVIGGALGATRLGDTYQAANQVSNLLFELLAAGTLSAVLIPELTQRLVRNDLEHAEAFAGALLARAIAVLGALGLVGIVAARPIMNVLLSGNDSGSRDAQVRLGVFLLFFVMPQLVLYAWGSVMTAVLNANGKFAAGAAAPVANNVLVILAVGVFWLRDAQGLELGWIDRTLLGAGALGGVLCMTLVPVVVAARHGLHVRPRWATMDPLAMSIHEVGWATLVVVPAQLFLFVAMVVSSRVPGGVVATQFGFILFLLPHALLGQPLATVLFPRLAREWASGDMERFHSDGASGLRVQLLLTAPAAALLVALASWILPAVAFGALAHGTGPALVAAALMGYGVGVTAYSWSLFSSRLSYASGDVRTPGVAALAAAAIGVAMLGVATRGDGSALLYRVGLAHTLMAATAALFTLAVLMRRGVVVIRWTQWSGIAAAAVLAGIAARVAADRVGLPASRGEAIAGMAAGALAGLAVYGVGIALLGVRLREMRAEPA